MSEDKQQTTKPEGLPYCEKQIQNIPLSKTDGTNMLMYMYLLQHTAESGGGVCYTFIFKYLNLPGGMQ